MMEGRVALEVREERRAEVGPRMWSWPRTSSMLSGRIRSASGSLGGGALGGATLRRFEGGGGEESVD